MTTSKATAGRLSPAPWRFSRTSVTRNRYAPPATKVDPDTESSPDTENGTRENRRSLGEYLTLASLIGSLLFWTSIVFAGPLQEQLSQFSPAALLLGIVGLGLNALALWLLATAAARRGFRLHCVLWHSDILGDTAFRRKGSASTHYRPSTIGSMVPVTRP